MARLDATARQVVISGLAVAIIGLAGGILSAWPFAWFGIITIVLGLAAAGVAYLGATGTMPAASPVSGRGVELAAGLIAAVLGIGGLIESIFDITDDLTEVSFWTTTVLYLLLAAAGLWLVVASGRRWAGGVTEAIGPARRGGRGMRLVTIGVLLLIVGWFLNVSISFWRWYPSAEAVTLAILALVIVLLIAGGKNDLRLPIPGEWIAAGLSVVVAILALTHLQRFMELGEDFSIGVTHWLAVVVYLVGVGLLVAGAVLLAIDAQNARAAARAASSPSEPPESPAG